MKINIYCMYTDRHNGSPPLLAINEYPDGSEPTDRTQLICEDCSLKDAQQMPPQDPT